MRVDGMTVLFAVVVLIIGIGAVIIFRPASTAPTPATTGFATMPANTTSTLIAHGLGKTPDRIFLSARSNPEGRSFWATTVGPANFTLVVSATSTGSVSFDWRAQKDE